MADDVQAMSEELASDPTSLVFLALGEALRRRGELDAAARVALSGLEHHPNLAEAHDLHARVLADAGSLEQAADAWAVALSLDPRHGGAHKGLGFVSYRRGDYEAALDHLELALAADPTEHSVIQALQTVRAAAEGAARQAKEPPAPAPAPAPGAAAAGGGGVFAGLEGADSGLLLVDIHGRLLGGGLRTAEGAAVGEEVAAYLAGVSQEAERTARLLNLGEWRWIVAEAPAGHLHLSLPAEDVLLLLARDRSLPSGRLAMLAARAAQVARRWLELQKL